MVTRYVEVDSIVFEVTLTPHGDGWAATHGATHAFGTGDTIDAALVAFRAYLVQDRDWFCGPGALAHLTGALAERRRHFQTLFGCKVNR